MHSLDRRSTTDEDRASADERWIAAAQAGDREAFDLLLRRHYRRIHGTLFRLVGNPEDADDLAQETFVRAWKSLRFYNGKAPFGAWLVRIAVHLATDHFRARGRRAGVVGLEAMALEPAAAGGEPGERLSQVEARRLVAEAVEELPTNLRVALVLRVLEGRPYEEVAAATGVRPGTVRTQVMRARKLLERLLAPLLEGRRDA